MKKKINLKELKLLRLRGRRLTYRSLLITIGIIATVIVAFNFWFIDHAEDALEQIVYRQSKGKLKLKVADFKFNWIKNKIELDTASIISTDSTQPVLYSVTTDRISIKARGFLPLLIRKQILIDSIRLSAPNIVFTRIEAKQKKSAAYKDSVKAANGNEKFSVAEEMGRISQSITDAINMLQVHQFRLDNGSFSLIDKTKPNDAPFMVDKVFVELDNVQIDSSNNTRKARKKINFTDNIAIRTSDQNISFPGGRHFLSFKNFRFNLQNKRVEFDSCTLRAVKGDSSKTSFRIFFDKLQLTNINFDSLYSTETIIADSVFCNQPQIYLDVDGDQKTAKKSVKTAPKEKIDAVIQQMLGDLRLNYVGVINSNIDVNTIKKGKTSTFSAKNTNFEMYGLVVRQDQQRPINLNKFMMSLHNFENVLGDGRYAIAFDSIGFEDDVINLNKFSFKEFDRGHAVKSLSMPSFQVRGLSWESLLYDNVFSAQNASFYKPLVDYTTTGKSKKKKSKNIFGTLNSIDDVMDLKNLGIQQGDITLRFGKNASLHLQNTNLDLRAQDLTAASKIKTVQRSVKELNFDKGIFKKGDLTALLNKVRLSNDKNGIHVNNMLISSNNMRAKANYINIGNVVLDSVNQSIIIDGVWWRNADMKMDGAPTKKGKTAKPAKKTELVLKNINGKNTNVDVAIEQSKITGYFNTIAIKEFTKNKAGKPEIKGLSLDGNNFSFLGPATKASVKEMNITDRNNSVLKDIVFEKINSVDSILAIIPQLTIIPNITEIVSGNLTLKGLVIKDPVVKAHIGKKDSTQTSEKKKAPSVSLASVLFQRPDIKLAFVNKNNETTYVNWDGVKLNSYLKITNLHSNVNDPLKADQIKMFLTHFELINAKGKKTATNDNKLNIELNNVLLHKNDANKLDWRASLNVLSLDKLFFDSLGKNNMQLSLDKGDIRNVALNSKYINSVSAIIANSNKLSMSGTNGYLLTNKNDLYWYGFKIKNNSFVLDSLNFYPKQSIEDYRVAKAFNEDYLKIKTGKISGGPIDFLKYSKDSSLNIGQIELNDIDLLTFKDKTQPDTATKYKPLPVDMLFKMNGKLNIDSVKINNMKATYWEINPSTDSLGIVPVYDLNVLIKNIKNYDIKNDDSIYVFANAKVLNSLYTTLDVSQSYVDTSGYLTMHLTTGSMDLTGFNPVLVPLVGAKVFRGNLDRLEMFTVGNNDANIGTARMYYKGLKVGLLDKKHLPRQTFINKVVSAIAMTFIVRKNNRGKESLVFFERWQDKSPVNYIVKTSLEAIKSSIGLPGAKKKLRKYKKKMEKETTRR